jgi:hypothetical protein
MCSAWRVLTSAGHTASIRTVPLVPLFGVGSQMRIEQLTDTPFPRTDESAI